MGKISFSNSKTPKPLLNIKRPEVDQRPPTARRQSKPPTAAGERKAILRAIENVYGCLMRMEDHERHMPPQIGPNTNEAAVKEHMEWQGKIQAYNKQLFDELKVLEPIMTK